MIALALFMMCLWCLVDVTDEVKTISVMEGDPFTLHTEVNEIQKYLLIQWMFGSTRIAEINRLTQTNSTYDADGRFRGRLKLDQNGSLTIANTSTTDSGLYQLATVIRETSYMNFNVTVCAAPHSSSPSERVSSSNCVTSSCAVHNSVVNHTEDANITELFQPSSVCNGHCGSTEAVIRLVLSVLVGVAAVAVLVYDIRSTRSELDMTEETEDLYETYGGKSDLHYELSRRLSCPKQALY
ncbi:uncharacterized protein LOC113099133 isoform X2 [Carassius auratus]|uniref:Uncharacterized protein LOC113099133 isoform X2 n=1 Tax=Carassius auratus TaxID=7957 RepID=A0A6P6PGY0_CARAU|nr:uncharacterized protein LOC113099133 isoform X2 [Carassius auratus]